MQGKQAFGTDEVYFGKEFVGLQHIGDGGTQQIGEFYQDADYLSAFVCFEFADAVVGFHHFGGFNEDCLSTCRLVMYDTFDFTFQSRCYGNYQTTVAHGGGDVFIYHTFRLGIAQDAVQRTGNTVHGICQFTADTCQFGGGIILYFPVR